MAITSLRRLDTWALTTDSVGSITLTNTWSVAESQWIIWGSMDTGTWNWKYMTSSSNSITNRNSYTISLWYSPNAQPSSREQTMALFGTSASPNCNVYLVYWDQRIWWLVKWVSVIRSRSNVAWLAINHTLTMDLGKWYNIVSTYNWTTFTLYVDWVLIASWSQSWSWSWWSSFSRIWEEPSNSTYWAWRWRMDNISIDDSVRAAAEIKNSFLLAKWFI